MPAGIENEDALKQELAQIDEQLKQENEKLLVVKRGYKDDPEYNRIMNLLNEIQAEKDKTYKERNKLEQKARGQFLSNANDGGWNTYPYYRRNDSYSSRTETNIFDEVLNAIGKHVKLRLLKASDIEVLVSELIVLEKKKYPRIAEIDSRRAVLDAKERIVYQERRDIEDKENEIDRVIYRLRDRKRDIEYKLNNPKIQKMVDEREAERQKSKNADVIKAIHKMLDEGDE
jgi:hypothetical protein